MNQTTLDQMVDHPAIIEGIARDAHAGAVVLTADRTPVYIDGLDCWDDKTSGQQVRVHGTLRRRKLAPDPVVDPEGGISHGIKGDNYVLEGAKWSVA